MCLLKIIQMVKRRVAYCKDFIWLDIQTSHMTYVDNIFSEASAAFVNFTISNTIYSQDPKSA